MGIFLGRHARQRGDERAEAQQQLLPAKLRWQSREATYLRPVAVEHPALAELRDLAESCRGPSFPCFKYWELEAGAEPAHVVASFANGKPALVERQIGAGRVLMMTTPVSDPAHDDPWNLLPTGRIRGHFCAGQWHRANTWPAAGDDAAQLPGRANGRVAAVAGRTGRRATCCRCRTAARCGNRSRRASRDLSIAPTEMLGNYRVRAGGRQDGSTAASA